MAGSSGRSTLMRDPAGDKYHPILYRFGLTMQRRWLVRDLICPVPDPVSRFWESISKDYSMRTYSTIITTDDYLLGALTLHKSLMLTRPRYELLVVLTK